jgi:hypothetical protein
MLLAGTAVKHLAFLKRAGLTLNFPVSRMPKTFRMRHLVARDRQLVLIHLPGIGVTQSLFAAKLANHAFVQQVHLEVNELLVILGAHQDCEVVSQSLPDELVVVDLHHHTTMCKGTLDTLASIHTSAIFGRGLML